MNKAGQNQAPRRYKICMSSKVLKNYNQLPEKIRDKFDTLYRDLEKYGPMPFGWTNLSKLGPNEYHCHLQYRWVACWRYIKGAIEISVYYLGSRENAPY